MSEKYKFTNRFYFILMGVALGLNLIWEIGQMSAFDKKPGDTLIEQIYFCSLAAVIDSVVTLTIFLFILLFFQKLNWKFYCASAVTGVICAVFFEWMARAFHLWSYGEKMFVLPFLQTGLLPFIQLTILVPTAIWLSTKLNNERG